MGVESERHRTGKRKDWSCLCFSLNKVLSDGRSNQMGVTSSALSPGVSGFENNAERLIGARLPWGRVPGAEAVSL